MKKILIISMVLLILVITYNEDKELAAIGFEEEAPVVKSEIVVEDVVYEPAPIIRPEPKTEPMPDPDIPSVVEISEPKDVRTFRVTAYCSCKKCCGKWALNRPLDENGNEIVYGASGEVLVSGISCASPLPFGTNVELSGYGTVTVEDRIADWVVEKYGENLIDIYFSDHEAARQWGLQTLEGEVING